MTGKRWYKSITMHGKSEDRKYLVYDLGLPKKFYSRRCERINSRVRTKGFSGWWTPPRIRRSQAKGKTRRLMQKQSYREKVFSELAEDYM